MAKYPLTERQKKLLRSIASGLEDGTIETEWSIFRGGDRIQGIFGLGKDGKLWREVWKNSLKFSDFEAFITCGFFKRTPTGGYILNEFLILDAVNHDFKDDQVYVSQVTISGGDFRGAIVNAGSIVDNVQQSIDSTEDSD